MFIWIPKTNLTILFFLEILHYKEPCNLISWKHFGPELENQNFPRYGIGGKISTTVLFSILDYLQEKLIKIFFKKSKKNIIFGPFGQIWTKMDFPGKRGSVSFWIFRFSPIVPKIRKIIGPFLRKTPNWWTDRQRDRQQRFYRTLQGSTIGIHHIPAFIGVSMILDMWMSTNTLNFSLWFFEVLIIFLILIT